MKTDSALRFAGLMSLLAPLVGCSGSVTLSLTQAELQAGIETYFPVDSDDYVDEDVAVRVTLSEPKVLLESGSDRIGLQLRVVAEPREDAEGSGGAKNRTSVTIAGPRPAARPSPSGRLPFPPPQTDLPSPLPDNPDGRVSVSGSVSYRSDEGAFYFLDPAVDEIAFDKAHPPAMDAAVRKVVGKLLSRYLEDHAVYMLSDADTKAKAAKLLLKSVSVHDGSLRVELGP